MQFTISGSGTKAEVLANLESQKEASPDYASLKNQLIEHVAAHIEAAPADATGYSVSISAYIGYTLPAKPEG